MHVFSLYLGNWQFWQYYYAVAHTNDDYFWDAILYPKYFYHGSACNSHGCHNLWMYELCHILSHTEIGLIYLYSWSTEVKPHSLIISYNVFFWAPHLQSLHFAISWQLLVYSALNHALNWTSAVEQHRAIARRNVYWTYKAVIKFWFFSNTLFNLGLAKQIIEENAGEYAKEAL